MKKKRPQDKVIRNRRASFDYELSDNFVLGLQLNGREVKSLRLGHGSLQGAYVTLKDGELWLLNAAIQGTHGVPIQEEEVHRTRKLLAKKKEIDQMIAAKQQGRTLVPTDILTKGRFIKIKVAIGKGKKAFDKRDSIKRRDDNRNSQRELSKRYV